MTQLPALYQLLALVIHNGANPEKKGKQSLCDQLLSEDEIRTQLSVSY